MKRKSYGSRPFWPRRLYTFGTFSPPPRPYGGGPEETITMYIPKHFAIDGTNACHQVIVDNDFGELVTLDDDGLPFASHLPFLIDTTRGASGTLMAHMARANPQWRHFTSGKAALAMF